MFSKVFQSVFSGCSKVFEVFVRFSTTCLSFFIRCSRFGHLTPLEDPHPAVTSRCSGEVLGTF